RREGGPHARRHHRPRGPAHRLGPRRHRSRAQRARRVGRMDPIVFQSRALDWAIMSISLFNTMVLLWLGLTVLLNAESRPWGIWLAGGMLLLGAAFFVSHTVILAHQVNNNDKWMDFWWHAAWAPVLASPLGWYVSMLWYSGFWDGGEPYMLLRRQRPWLIVAGLLALSVVWLLLFANPLPSYSQVVRLSLSTTPSIG